MILVIDFDGTITPQDTTVELLKKFADPRWEEIEEKWIRGDIGSKDCMAEQIRLLKITPVELDAYIQTVQLDPTFLPFLAKVTRFAEVAVISDGLDVVSRKVLNQIPYPLEIYSNKLHFIEKIPTLFFPYNSSECPYKQGVCKCALANRYSKPVILIGDGRSDFCLAEKADHVFAKGTLQKLCSEKLIPHHPFENFEDILAFFDVNAIIV